MLSFCRLVIIGVLTFFPWHLNAKDKIHIFMGSDDNYVKPTAVSMMSLLENHPENDIFMHIFDFGMSPEPRNILQSLCSKKNAALEFIPFNEEQANGLQSNNHWPLGVFAKYWIPNYAQGHGIDKAIWLDGDTIVDGDIRRLWSIDLDDNYLAGGKELGWEALKACYGMSHQISSLNSGVLLFNCKKMYNDNLLHKILQKAAELRGIAISVDQDALSFATADHQVILPMEFNFQTYYHYVYSMTAAGADEDTKKSVMAISLRSVREHVPLPIRDVLVYHYEGPIKPWSFKAIGPYNEKWYRYLRLTPYWGVKEALKAEYAMQLSLFCGGIVRAISAIGRAIL
jgi:lipopolysaccharide biosynthesis glycosyltransferase